MPLEFVRNDITKMQVDAIVNSTNPSYRALGGADYAIHKAAGAELDLYCSKLEKCRKGQAVITPAFNLPCKYIIHTVASSFGFSEKVQDVLKKCYISCLNLAKEQGIKSLAFPLMGSGTYGCPKDRALQIAMDTIRDFLFENEMEIYIVVYDKKAFSISSKLQADVKAFIDDHYVEEKQQIPTQGNRKFEMPSVSKKASLQSFQDASYDEEESEMLSSCRYDAEAADFSFCAAGSFDKYMLDESFSAMLLRLIDESGMKDSECYNRANVSRQVFSKIRSSDDYIPNKTTILALAIALRLDLQTTRELLDKAGYSLSHSRLLDVIVESFIVKGQYDIFKINSVLYEYDQLQLGARSV